MNSVQHKRSNKTNHFPTAADIEYGEFAINYKAGEEKIFIKNDNDEIVYFSSQNKPLIEFTDNVITLSPNIYYRKTNQSTELTIYLGTETNGTIMNEYLIEFTTLSNGTTISMPSSIKWSNGELPIFEPNSTYQISVVNNLGVCTKFK